MPFEIIRIGISFRDSIASDKVWGIGMRDGKLFRFRGRRIGTLFLQSHCKKSVWATWNKKVSSDFVDVTNNPRFAETRLQLTQKVEAALASR